MTGTAISFAQVRNRRCSLGLTPLVDVIFLLVVFYLLVSQFAQLQTLDVSVDEPSTVSSEPDQWTISVSSSNDVLLNGAPTSIDTIATDLLSAQPNEATMLTIRVAPGVPLQIAVTVLEEARRAGVSKASLRAWEREP